MTLQEIIRAFLCGALGGALVLIGYVLGFFVGLAKGLKREKYSPQEHP